MKDPAVKRVIIDCDPGADDALAILFAIRSGPMIVDSITTVNGNVPVQQGTSNALRILSFLDRPDIPVCKGASRPLRVGPVYSRHVFGPDGLGNISSSLPLAAKAVQTDAVSHILNTIRSGKIDMIIAIGPLTNIALAYKRNAALMNSLQQIIIMGGAIRVKGNITAFAEFNFYCDPHAAGYVLRKSTNSVLVPLDVTMQAKFYSPDIKKINNTKEQKLVRQITKPWFAFSRSVGLDFVSLHDPLAAAFSIRRYLPGGIFSTRKTHVKLHVDGDHRGHCERSSHPGERKGFVPVRYCHSLDNNRFLQIFLDTINDHK